MDTIEYRGFTIRIETEDDPQNPREDNDNLSVIACFHKRYNLGDANDYNSSDYGSWDEMLEAITKREKPIAIAQLFLYDHSGLRIKVGSFNGLLPQGHAEWDSGPVGFAWITRKTILKWLGWKRMKPSRKAEYDKIVSEAEVRIWADVSTYDDFISGSVYRYFIEDAEGDQIEDGSCGGYLGYDSIKNEEAPAYMDAKAAVDAEITRREKDALSAKENDPSQLKLALEGVA